MFGGLITRFRRPPTLIKQPDGSILFRARIVCVGRGNSGRFGIMGIEDPDGFIISHSRTYYALGGCPVPDSVAPYDTVMVRATPDEPSSYIPDTCSFVRDERGHVATREQLRVARLIR